MAASTTASIRLAASVVEKDIQREEAKPDHLEGQGAPRRRGTSSRGGPMPSRPFSTRLGRRGER